MSSTKPVFNLPLAGGGTVASKSGLDDEVNRVVDQLWPMSPDGPAGVLDEVNAARALAAAWAESDTPPGGEGTASAKTHAAAAALYDGPWLDSVAALMADTALTYSSGSGQVTVGQIVRTRAEGFSFTVAASSASDYHLATAGGVRLYVIPGDDVQDVRRWGIFPGADPSLTDARLIRMRDSLRALDEHRHWKLFFPTGLYQYSDNKWVRLRKLEIIGHGAKLQCLDPTGTTLMRRAFNHSTPFYRNGDNDMDYGTLFLGHPIETVLSGKNQIVLKTPANASQYAVGDRILIASRDVQFGGFPPNLAHFQFTRIAAISGATLTLADKTLHEYREDDTHQTSGDYSGVGKASIWGLDRGYADYVHPEVFIMRGVTLVKNPASTWGQGEVLTGDYCLWDDVKFHFDGAGDGFYIWPTIGGTIKATRLKATGEKGLNGDLDKLVSSFTLTDTVVDGTTFTAGTGVKRLLMRDVRFMVIPNLSAAEYLQYDRCDFAFTPNDEYGMIKSSNAFGPGQINISGCTFRPPSDFGNLHIVNDFSDIQVVPSSVPSTDVLYFNPASTEGRKLAGSARPGRTIWSLDGTDVGTITSITQDEDGFRVEIAWVRSSTPSVSKTYAIPKSAGAVDGGGNVMDRPRQMFRNMQQYSSVGALTDGRGLIRRGADIDFGAAVPGGVVELFSRAPRYITRYAVNVIRPCTGPNTLASMNIFFSQHQSGGAAPARAVSINLKIAGLRVITPAGNTGLKTLDTSALADELYWRAYGTPWGDGKALYLEYSTPKTQRPLVEFEIDYQVPRAW